MNSVTSCVKWLFWIAMATEAQRLISISLSKIAQSRASRGGVSLHKNLLVATVLHKARYVFMEEAYQMVQKADKENQCPSNCLKRRRSSAESDDATSKRTKSSNSNNNTDEEEESMEIDRITSLVSIFSFGGLTRSVSMPDLCASQAKEAAASVTTDTRPFLAMAVWSAKSVSTFNMVYISFPQFHLYNFQV